MKNASNASALKAENHKYKKNKKNKKKLKQKKLYNDSLTRTLILSRTILNETIEL